MKDIGVIKEPTFGYDQKITMVPIEKLKVIEIQRKPSARHVRRLTESMKKVGFITPLVAVFRKDECLVIDGQQRLLAAKELGISELPCLILPEKYALSLMELNVEKQMSLREKAYVALNVYRAFLEEDASVKEDDPRIQDSIEFPHYITLGIGYEKNPKLFGSAYEPILKKLDNFLALPLKEALSKREEKANLILETDEIARRVVEKVKEIGIAHPYVYREVVDFCNPIKKGKIMNLEQVFEELKDNLRDLSQHPEKMRRLKIEDPEI